MRKINLAISGCLGRMGQQLIKSVRANKDFNLVTLTENKILNKKIAGIKLNLN
jgi:4-hydroxy-tetrahydrodipicolinate reductase